MSYNNSSPQSGNNDIRKNWGCYKCGGPHMIATVTGSNIVAKLYITVAGTVAE